MSCQSMCPCTTPSIMSKSLYSSARGRVSNRGDLPRFIGLFPCVKADEGVLVFRSITELKVAEYLAWLPQVVKISYERAEVRFDAHGSLPPVSCWPDFEVVLEGGEVEWVEAKYSEHGLSSEERTHLALLAAHFAREERRYRVVYRQEIEQNGFCASISLLRPYGRLHFSGAQVEGALRRLDVYRAQYLEDWVTLAESARVPTDLLYHLLYHQKLPMLYRPMIHPELRKCRS